MILSYHYHILLFIITKKQIAIVFCIITVNVLILFKSTCIYFYNMYIIDVHKDKYKYEEKKEYNKSLYNYFYKIQIKLYPYEY